LPGEVNSEPCKKNKFSIDKTSIFENIVVIDSDMADLIPVRNQGQNGSPEIDKSI
jgi:hypothetical protein